MFTRGLRLMAYAAKRFAAGTRVLTGRLRHVWRLRHNTQLARTADELAAFLMLHAGNAWET
jgi:hypothetical protein